MGALKIIRGIMLFAGVSASLLALFYNLFEALDIATRTEQDAMYHLLVAIFAFLLARDFFAAIARIMPTILSES